MKMKITGMHCESCEMLIRDIFEEHGIKADVTQGLANFEPGSTDMEKLKAEIRDEGFGV